jgi:DNA-binding transcriptional ArsR family regulator
VSDLFEALSAPARRAILDELHERDGQALFELCTRLVTRHGLEMSRQAISQHLDVLEAAGLVRTRRDGRYKFHHIDTGRLREIMERWAPPERVRGSLMRVVLTSVYVDDQDKALTFYTEVLGFVKKKDISFGKSRWLTVVSAHDPDGTELVLEPDNHPAMRPFKDALVEDGIPFTSFGVGDVHAECERLESLGVRFTQAPVEMGPAITAVFDDTCGNLIQIAQTRAP